jgi:ATP-dependent Clp protease ATP-binding subunit ClpX
MLKLIEGKRVKIPSSVTGDTGNPPPYISTNKILFCFGGAFNGLHKIVAKKMGKKEKTIGLRSDSDYNEEFQKQLESYEILKSASQDILVESLIEYGLSAEFVGRIQNIVALAPLNKEELMKCLMEIDSSPVNKQQLLFAESGIHLKFDDDFLNNVVDKVEKMGTGTRALNTLVKKAVSYAAFEHLGYSGKKPKSITILQECLDDPQKYLIEY